ncbi:hypothetical protein Rrhod_1893 [Rhodococcus rhodnii LMG 5362]|uniref:Uncharacterized protein n=1 Tax=Rhodococcus rhodnii LMG 5362 TaxID=1273125 RepID=R7WNA5_9NOCA|nr:hypothetical protein Rrhod_1893 [Rhodococcus rhodnii LMG 5362]
MESRVRIDATESLGRASPRLREYAAENRNQS